jgi:hypothetical protein
MNVLVKFGSLRTGGVVTAFLSLRNVSLVEEVQRKAFFFHEAVKGEAMTP